jgi:osmotically-inducible protein OsmY
MFRHHQPEIRYESSSTSFFALVGAAAVGAALMYLLQNNATARESAVREEPVDDTVLAERVRAAMGRVISDPHAIEVRVNEGCVTLKGPALQDEIGELVACTERVRGVRQVDNRLSVSSAAS